MRTVVFDEPGPANVLHVAEVLLEPLGSRDIRIRYDKQGCPDGQSDSMASDIHICQRRTPGLR